MILVQEVRVTVSILIFLLLAVQQTPRKTGDQAPALVPSVAEIRRRLHLLWLSRVLHDFAYTSVSV